RPLSVREVLEDLRGERALAYTTVMTVMDNLHRKGWLVRHQQGRAYLYRPAASKEAYTAGLMNQAFAGAGDPAATLVHFVEALSPEEAATLRRALGDQGHSAATVADSTVADSTVENSAAANSTVEKDER
ncbi:MAG: BlaI/MecI/CopY family transcriptional regulator, partial [Actinomycetota bacterium]|nr:BlaI/MecI/CopY family transcriptional regulator [Actinomycetota bacterium]